MERILRSEEMAEIIFLPVRHHSPACAFHVKRMIEKLRPAKILVEGPQNANELLSVMVHGETRAPFAVYYSYDDAQGRISEEREQYKCYYPFLDYSPELAALRAGAELDIPCAFIDLPFGDILAASGAGAGLRSKKEKNNYNDDYLLAQNDYIKALCEKSGLQSFDQFWEKYFEVNGYSMDGEAWFAGLLSYCKLARENTARRQMEADGTLARELYMRGQILREAKLLRRAGEARCLFVITGGFHTPALAKDLRQEADAIENELERLALTRIPRERQGVYLMPYSMEAADALNGYASGMPYPGYYQKIWEKLGSSARPYEETALQFIVSSGKETRKKEGMLSTYDEICADAMARGLAKLRGKQEPGAYELIDAVLSSFVKGEYNIATDTPMRILQKQMTGDAMGELCRDAKVPPILHDFREQCKRYKLKVATTLTGEVTLSIFAKKRHREESAFFHQLNFLDAPYARRVKGPNLQRGTDRNLMREIWKYKWSAGVEAALIDASVYGATVEEAAVGMVRASLKKENDAGACALLLSQVFEMDLRGQLDAVYDNMQEVLVRETDFFALAKALKLLRKLRQLRELYQSNLVIEPLLESCCRKLILLLPSMAAVKEDDAPACMEALKLLYQTFGSAQELAELKEEFLRVLGDATESQKVHPGFLGCAQGILYGCGSKSAQEIEYAARGYLTGTAEQTKKVAEFFHGLFFAAKDIIFTSRTFLELLDGFFGEVNGEAFMKILPELRMAFTYFTPGEIDRIAKLAAGIHGKSGGQVTGQDGVPADWYAYGRQLDEYVRTQLGVR